ncbi:MAG: tripartite tricarboxylate transporter substrate-binding protein [Pseudolabrys sp.]
MFPPALPHIKSGRLRALAVSSAQRSEVLPDVPTMQEAGVPDFDVANWYGFVAPAGTSKEIVAKLNHEITIIMKDPNVRQRLADLGGEPQSTTPEEFSAFIKSEVARWAAAVKESGIPVVESGNSK